MIPLRFDPCGSVAMRSNIFVEVTAVERARLEALVGDPQAAQQHVWRARIVLLTADGLGTMEIMRRTGKSTADGVTLAGAVHGRAGGWFVV